MYKKKLKEALDVLQEYPESGVYLIPARLDDCDVSDTRLEELNYIDLFPNWDEGFRSILDTIQHAEGDGVQTADYERGNNLVFHLLQKQFSSIEATIHHAIQTRDDSSYRITVLSSEGNEHYFK